jgi:large subunit ribosomal protein L35
MKNKLKTRSSTQKRYKKTGTGKFIRRKAFKGHILEKKKC